MESAVPNPRPVSPNAPSERLTVIDAEKLFDKSQELRLNFRGAEYRLRITRQGKLILTK